jgi:5,6,7,8-tetrahydromethanopterin hydro-lyase
LLPSEATSSTKGRATIWRRLQELVFRWRGSEVAVGPKSVTKATTTRIAGLCTGEALVGEGNEIAHIDLIMGPRGSAAEKAFANSLTNNKDGFTSLLAVIAPNLMVKPATVMFNKVTIKDAKQAVQMFGPAQHAVAKAVADSLAEGVIPRDQADDLFICVGVFIHWDAADNKKIQDYNYRATKEAIARAIGGDPKAAEVIAKRNLVKHPFAA